MDIWAGNREFRQSVKRHCLWHKIFSEQTILIFGFLTIFFLISIELLLVIETIFHDYIFVFLAGENILDGVNVGKIL